MVKSPAFDKSFKLYKCSYYDTELIYIHDGYQKTIQDLNRKCAKNFPIFIVVLVGTLLLLCAVAGAIVYR
jgi:hypothetical protein